MRIPTTISRVSDLIKKGLDLRVLIVIAETVTEMEFCRS